MVKKKNNTKQATRKRLPKLPPESEIRKMDALAVYRMMKKRQEAAQSKTTTTPLKKSVKKKEPLLKGTKPWTRGYKRKGFGQGTVEEVKKKMARRKKIIKRT